MFRFALLDGKFSLFECKFTGVESELGSMSPKRARVLSILVSQVRYYLGVELNVSVLWRVYTCQCVMQLMFVVGLVLWGDVFGLGS